MSREALHCCRRRTAVGGADIVHLGFVLTAPPGHSAHGERTSSPVAAATTGHHGAELAVQRDPLGDRSIEGR